MVTTDDNDVEIVGQSWTSMPQPDLLCGPSVTVSCLTSSGRSASHPIDLTLSGSDDM
jgi:hypothetical protein